MFGKKEEKYVDFHFYTCYDSKTRIYEEPTYARNDDDLIRQLNNLFADPKSAQHKFVTNPEDFTIFRIGSFDKRKGTLDADNMTSVVSLHELASAAKARASTQTV